MKIKHIFICFFSLSIVSLSGQQQKDSVRMSPKYQPNFLVGFDVLNAGISLFSDRKIFQGSVSSEIRPKMYANLVAGFEKNIYQKNGYDAVANGPFIKLGGTYMLAHDAENTRNGFFAGARVAGSFYTQEYKAVPIRGFSGASASQAFPSSSQSSYWAEVVVGGRIQLFESPFYIEVTGEPRYLLFTTKQEDIVPMIVPGFGKSSAKFNMGFSWSISYLF